MQDNNEYNNNESVIDDSNKVKYKINTNKMQLRVGYKHQKEHNTNGKRRLFISIMIAILIIAFIIGIISIVSKSDNTRNNTSDSSESQNVSTNNTDSDKKTQNNQNINDITAPLTSQTENLEFNTQISAELNLWFIADNEYDTDFIIYRQAIEQIKKDYPNIIIHAESFPNEMYKSKIRTAIANNSAPDIFFCWAGSFLGDFVNADKIYCLDDILDKYIGNELSEAMLINSTYNGKHYGVPTSMNFVTLFANLDMLSKVGYDHIPTTKNELFDCCDKLVSKGYVPFGCSFKENWCITEYLEPIIEKTIGATELNDIFRNGKTWNNAGITTAIDTLQQMINNGYFDPNAIALSNEEAKANFMAGKYAFYQNGSWNCGDFSDPAKTSFNIAAGEWPAMTSNATNNQLIGGPTNTLVVSSNSKNAYIAAEYAAILGKLVSEYSYNYGSGFPTWSISIENDWSLFDVLDNHSDLINSCAQLGLSANAFVLYGDNAMHAEDADIYLTYVSKIYKNRIYGKEFVSELAKQIR